MHNTMCFGAFLLMIATSISTVDKLKATVVTGPTLEDLRIFKSSKNLHNFSYVIEPEPCSRDTQLLLSFHSAVNYGARRDLIRYSWATPSMMEWATGLKTKVIFLLGYDPSRKEAVEYEAGHYNDVLQMSFIDHYHNNTYKALYHFRWVAKNCPGVNVVMKCDDDMLIHPQKLMLVFEKIRMEKTKFNRLYMGRLDTKSVAHRNPQSPWFVPWSIFPHKVYPDYSFGGCYFLTPTILNEIFEASFQGPYMLMDDVYLGILVGKIGNISTIDLVDYFPKKSQIVYLEKYEKLLSNWLGNNQETVYHMPKQDYFIKLWQAWLQHTPVGAEHHLVRNGE